MCVWFGNSFFFFFSLNDPSINLDYQVLIPVSLLWILSMSYYLFPHSMKANQMPLSLNLWRLSKVTAKLYKESVSIQTWFQVFNFQGEGKPKSSFHKEAKFFGKQFWLRGLWFPESAVSWVWCSHCSSFLNSGTKPKVKEFLTGVQNNVFFFSSQRNWKADS